MSPLSKVFIVKIAATVLFWCLPLILLPASLMEAVGFPKQDTYLFVRLLGCAYLALCAGYGFGLRSSLQGKRTLGPIWVGIVSNGGAFLVLCYYGLAGSWVSWGRAIQLIGWASVVASFSIALALFVFGVRGQGEAA